MWYRAAIITGILALGLSSAASAKPTSAQKCEAAKLKAAGKYHFCRSLAERKAALQGGAPDYSKCDSTLSKQWNAAETHFGMACPTSGDLTIVQNQATADANAIALRLAGTRFIDNGDDTVTDTQTGLMWEKKDNLDGNADYTNPHDADNIYSWSVTGPAYEVSSGTLYTDFLYKLNDCTWDFTTGNAGGFAGHCDWRLPSRDELVGIIDPTAPGCDANGCGSSFPYSACIDPAFGPTQVAPNICLTGGDYWTGSTISTTSSVDGTLDTAYASDFSVVCGAPGNCSLSEPKSGSIYVRAVRGGL